MMSTDGETVIFPSKKVSQTPQQEHLRKHIFGAVVSYLTVIHHGTHL